MAIKSIAKKNLSKSKNLLTKEIKILKVGDTCWRVVVSFFPTVAVNFFIESIRSEPNVFSMFSLSVVDFCVIDEMFIYESNKLHFIMK